MKENKKHKELIQKNNPVEKERNNKRKEKK